MFVVCFAGTTLTRRSFVGEGLSLSGRSHGLSACGDEAKANGSQRWRFSRVWWQHTDYFIHIGSKQSFTRQCTFRLLLKKRPETNKQTKKRWRSTDETTRSQYRPYSKSLADSGSDRGQWRTEISCRPFLKIYITEFIIKVNSLIRFGRR